MVFHGFSMVFSMVFCKPLWFKRDLPLNPQIRLNPWFSRFCFSGDLFIFLVFLKGLLGIFFRGFLSKS